jgi:sarcosine oxidase subunit alpha
LSPEAFPYQGVRRGQVAGVEALLMRVGFVGELGYEIHLEASKAEQVWNALFETGARWNIQPFGVEAQRLLRLEKGHLIVTHDTDALTYPHEVGLNWTLGKNKHFYVGQHSLKIQRQRSLTRQLVGLRWPENQTALPEECNLVIHDGRIAGRITSIVPQSTLGYPIGMAFVDPELSSPGTPIEIRLDNGVVSTAQVVEMPFYDPDDQRQLA